LADNEEITKPIRRESIWSVKEGDRPKLSIYFTVMFLMGMGFCVWYEIFYVTDDSVFDTIIALLRDVGIVGLASITLSFTRFEGGDAVGIALDLFRKQKYEEAYAEGHAEGRAETYRDWENWYERYKDAQEKGIPFDEPPPSRRNNGASRSRHTGK